MLPLAPVLTENSASQSLYSIEEHLAALVDTADMVTPAEERQFRDDLQIALTAAVEKRDRVGQFMAHLQQQIAFAAAEMNRLRDRKALYERALERIENYVIYTIEKLGRDSKGKYRKLEGKTVTFSLAGCPPSVAITDEAAVPLRYKQVTIKLPASTWEQILDCLGCEGRDAISAQARQEIAVDKRAISAAINMGDNVPGADLAIGNVRLKRA